MTRLQGHKTRCRGQFFVIKFCSGSRFAPPHCPDIDMARAHSPSASSNPGKKHKAGLLATNGMNGIGRPSPAGGAKSGLGASKKRAAVYMDSEDDEGSPNLRADVVDGADVLGRHWQRKGHVQVNGQPKALSIQEQRLQLPIARGKEALVREIIANDVTVVLGETGSGKTTQTPQYLLESKAFSGHIAVTQPRRVAATSLAQRVSVEQSRPLGTLIGYSVRFDERAGPDTRVKYLTDGMLVREMMSDPLLEKYGVIVVDEAHERSLRTDMVLASLKKILKVRNSGPENASIKGKAKAKPNPLKVVVMSATLDAEKFSKFFDNAKVLYVKGRQHPVTIYHTAASVNDYVDAALRVFFQIHTDQPSGDVLIFLPGQEDIENLASSIQTYAYQLPQNVAAVAVCPLYASLPQSQQTKVFAPTSPNTRKCILATNIAETSITIPGVKYVIDTGKQKEKRHVARDAGFGFDTLLTTDITKSSAMQRAGRAGREGKGFCFRLYTQEAFDNMPLSAEPEIRRSSLTSALLQLKCVGQDLETLDVMDSPDPESIGAALRTLWILGAIDKSKHLTDVGRSMASFPLEPHYAAILLAAVDNNCTAEIIPILSLLSASSPLFPDSSSERDAAAAARAKFRHPAGDHLTVLNVARSYDEICASEGKGARKEWCRRNYVNERALREAGDIREQLKGVCEQLEIDWHASCGDQDAPVLRSLVRGLVQHAAFLQPDGSYRQAMGPSTIRIHPGSTLSDKKSPAIIYDELVYTTHIYARGVTAVARSYISDVPVLVKSRDK